MELMPISPGGRKVIQAYGEQGFDISGRHWPGSVLVLPTGTVAWPISDVGALSLEHFEPVFAAGLGVEILLLGCGRTSALVRHDLRRGVRARGPVLEAMDTGAACRTYNVLIAEDRRVAAALMALSTPPPAS